MGNTYLNVDFKEKDKAKALGAKWDSAMRQWYVPEGRELTHFAQWLSSEVPIAQALPPLSAGKELELRHQKGISLSSLLAGVSRAVTHAYKSGVWVLVEVVELRAASGGHVFLGVSERDANGVVLAKTSAAIWQSTANNILPEFERATGAQLAPGIKLLVRARPVFRPQHGFSIEIDAIDSEYTLGDLEARKREIRERLHSDGVFNANKRLPVPWDFNNVLVVAPAGGAGLGDFQAEANRLETVGICKFFYAFSRFQGEGAAREICQTLQTALAAMRERDGDMPDAVVIIRGGGAVNDLAWLNEYDLARLICDMRVPVLTGIGHERDSTILDEVANIKFDTPSKVISGIEQIISKRASEAKSYFEQITHRSSRTTQLTRQSVVSLDVVIRTEVFRHVSMGRSTVESLMNVMKTSALKEVRTASERSLQSVQQVKDGAQRQLIQARHEVPMKWGQIALGAKHVLRAATASSDGILTGVLEQTQRSIIEARAQSNESIAAVGTIARYLLRDASTRSEALMREIAGQGPEKTLSRGFALIRDVNGSPITRAEQTEIGEAVEIQFNDGKVKAITVESN